MNQPTFITNTPYSYIRDNTKKVLEQFGLQVESKRMKKMLKINIAQALTDTLKERFEKSDKDQFIGKSRYDVVDVFTCQLSVDNAWTCKIHRLSEEQITLLRPIFENSLIKNISSYVEFNSKSFTTGPNGMTNRGMKVGKRSATYTGEYSFDGRNK